jgi:predicted secreted Zn-dependent protease
MKQASAQRRIRAGSALVSIALLFFGAIVPGAVAQDSFKWTTNYYRVTGLNPRQLRHSINENRPWRRRSDTDAVTTWAVTWNYAFASTPQGCRCENIRTTTTITTTLPLFVPGTNAPPELLQHWARYFTALTRHEAQHAAMANSAAADVRTALSSAGERGDCSSLQRDLNAAANQAIERRRREERELDLRTRHGAVDGARFP